MAKKKAVKKTRKSVVQIRNEELHKENGRLTDLLNKAQRHSEEQAAYIERMQRSSQTAGTMLMQQTIQSLSLANLAQFIDKSNQDLASELKSLAYVACNVDLAEILKAPAGNIRVEGVSEIVPGDVVVRILLRVAKYQDDMAKALGDTYKKIMGGSDVQGK